MIKQVEEGEETLEKIVGIHKRAKRKAPGQGWETEESAEIRKLYVEGSMKCGTAEVTVAFGEKQKAKLSVTAGLSGTGETGNIEEYRQIRCRDLRKDEKEALRWAIDVVRGRLRDPNE